MENFQNIVLLDLHWVIKKSGCVFYNKLFKSDSQRVVFLLCVAFGVYCGMRRLWYCVAHTLTGR